MPNKIFLVLWLFSSVPIKAQPPLKARRPMLDRTNNLLAAYDRLNPWQEYTRLRDIPFDQKNAMKSERIFQKEDSVETFYLLTYLQDEIIDAIWKQKIMQKKLNQ